MFTTTPHRNPHNLHPFLLFPPPRHQDVSVTYVELRRIRRRHRRRNRRHHPPAAIIRQPPPHRPFSKPLVKYIILHVIYIP